MIPLKAEAVTKKNRRVSSPYRPEDGKRKSQTGNTRSEKQLPFRNLDTIVHYPEKKTGITVASENNPFKDGETYPILLNHEKIFLIIFGIIAFFSFILAQLKSPILNAWIIVLIFSTLMTVTGVILDENLVNQIIVLFGANFSARVNRNHLFKSLKLGKLHNSRMIDYFLSILYAIGLIVGIRYGLEKTEFTLNDFRFFTDLVSKVPHPGIESEYSSLLYTSILIACIATAVFLTALVITVYFPKKIRTLLFYPFKFLFDLFTGFHELLKSIFRILFFIGVSWREFLTSCAHLMVSSLMAMGKSHTISNLEIKYLQYVKIILAVFGATGWLLCFIRVY